MPRLLVHSYTLSLDGYGAGPDQTLEIPMRTRPGYAPKSSNNYQANSSLTIRELSRSR